MWRTPSLIVEDAVLLTSELATNAVRHARSAFDVALTEQDGCLRVSVGDDHPDLPTLREKPSVAVDGHGLRLVQSLSNDWGAEPVPGVGKVVWFEVAS